MSEYDKVGFVLSPNISCAAGLLLLALLPNLGHVLHSLSTSDSSLTTQINFMHRVSS